MKKMKLIVCRVAIATSLFLSGCGGGGGGGTPPPPVDDNGTDDNIADPDPVLTYSACGNIDINLNAEALCATSSCGVDSIEIGTYSDEDTCTVVVNDWVSMFAPTDDNVVGGAENEDAVTRLNEVRASVGLHALRTNIKLEEAGTSHANYIRDAWATYNVAVSHYEYEEEYPSDYFTGVFAHDRAVYAGYETNSYVGEALTYVSADARDSVDELMSAIYHRHGLLFNFVDEVGVGVSGTENEDHSYTYELASKVDKQTALMATSPLIVAYPPQGSTDVRRVFYGETPDPLPDTSESGYPISIEFNSHYTVSVEVVSFRLYDESDTEITDTTLMSQDTDPNELFAYNQFALFPMQVLDGDHTYRVEVEYILNGESGTKTWSFTTRTEIDERA